MSFEVEDDFSPSSVETPQLLWDAVKIEVKRATCSFGRKQASWRQLHLSKLQDKREHILSSHPPTNTLVHWQEAGETSVKWLKMKIMLKALINYSSSANSFTSLLTSAHCDVPMAPITIDEIIQETARVKNKISSPGEDGLGYAFPYQLFRYPPLQELVLKVHNQTHNSSIFPHSWQELRVIPSLINRCQTGFMPNRFIAENGLVLNIILEHARKNNRQEIALLLDKKKAYDWVHPSYLRSVLLQLGFPTILMNSLVGLFLVTESGSTSTDTSQMK
ncbi:hypothetical protein G6F37_008183 [Rhizopus arrhizus]|nr:hypothetical protein G6F38_008786 [Rhizopus arrhizus]KAG1155828.1 hypothetical protein G6F37_008183 [Rhizopus arrhizus]